MASLPLSLAVIALTSPGQPAVLMTGELPSSAVWIRATWLGWAPSVPCVALLALIGEALGVGGAQALVGAGMGLGIGLLQARVLRRLGFPALPRICTCALGFALPFLIWDLGRAFGANWATHSWSA